MRRLPAGGLHAVFLVATSVVGQFASTRAATALAAPGFSDVTERAGLRFRHDPSRTSQKYLVETIGAGVAWLDYDGDGFLDLFFVNGAALADPMTKGTLPRKADPRFWNRLYRNTGRETFVDVTESAGVHGKGYGMGVAVGDYDNDGNNDLYVTNYGRNTLYRNQGDGTFEDVTPHAGVEGDGWASGAAFLDYDRDGDLDLVVARYLDWDFESNPWCGTSTDQRRYCDPNVFQSVSHLLFSNQGDGTFREVSQQAGITVSEGKGLGVSFNDYDRDGWPDIIVANDSVAQQLFHNIEGRFRERALELGLAYNMNGQEFAGMGVDFEDYSNDGWPDVIVNALSLEGYVLLRNDQGLFDDASSQSGIRKITMPHSGWGMKFIDYDNDGWKDVFVAQGHVLDTVAIDFPQIAYKQPLSLLRNIEGRFQDVSSGGGDALQTPRATRGAAFGDFNNDGFIDVALNVNSGPAVLLRNDGIGGNWLTLDTVGSSSNRGGVGARIRLVGHSGLVQHRIVSTASSYLSASDGRAHFGLGNDTLIREIELRWPSGIVQQIQGIEAGQILTVREPQASSEPAGSTLVTPDTPEVQ